MKALRLTVFFLILHPLFFSVSFAGIPEPETLIYGEVFNTFQGNRVTLTEGSIEWTVRKKGGDAETYIYSTEVECLECTEYENGECVQCENYSYRLKVPQEAVIAIEGMEVPDNVISLTPEKRQYDYVEVRVNGGTARVLPKWQYGNTAEGEPEGQFITAGQSRRSHYYRADLEIVTELGDTDGDGLPDWWEEEHGFNKDLADDAASDSDSDGWTNLDEFMKGTDPDESNAVPSLLSESITVYEGGTVLFRPEIADSDTPAENLKVRLLSMPQGIRMTFHTDSETSGHTHGKTLRTGDTVTLADIGGGKILLEQTGTGGADPVLSLELSDGTHPAVTVMLAAKIFRPTATDGTDAVFWGDAQTYTEMAEAGDTPLSVLPDRSGNDYDATCYHWSEEAGEHVPCAIDTDDAGPSGKPVIGLGMPEKGVLMPPAATPVFPSGDATVFSVFRAAGAGDQILASGPFFEIGVLGKNHPSHPEEIRVASSESAVYSNQRVTGGWVLAGIRISREGTHIDLNGLRAGSFPHEEMTDLGTDPLIGGKFEWIWDFDEERQNLVTHQSFDGNLAEMLVFDRVLPEIRKWHTYAYLSAKWLGYAVSDFSDVSRPVTVMAASGAEKMASYDADYNSDYSYYDDFVARFGSDYPCILIGGHAGDRLIGGFEDDILIGGPGADTLRGYGGADIFVVTDGDTVRDFNRDDGDVLYLTHLLEDTGRPLGAYLHFEITPDPQGGMNHTRLRIDADGDGSGFDDASVLLRLTVLRDTDLGRLWAAGHLHTGGPRPAVRVGIATRTADTDAFTVTFSESAVPAELALPVELDGAADDAEYGFETQTWNSRTGVYETTVVADSVIPVSLKPGDTSLPVRVVRLTDIAEDAPETVSVTLLPKGDFYDLGDVRSVTLTVSETGEATEPSVTHHSADYSPADFEISLSELLRVIQLYNGISYYCDPDGEDGYRFGEVGIRTCAPHTLDYNPQDWRISLGELLRVIQFYNSGGYSRSVGGEDGFSPKK